MKRLPGPCKYLKGDYCTVKAKTISVKDGHFTRVREVPEGETQVILDKGGPS